MPTSRLGRIAAFLFFGVLFTACIAVNAYLTYKISHPKRDLRVRIVLDTQAPDQEGVLPEALKARIESVSSIFEKAADIHLSVVGFMKVNATHTGVDPDNLRHFIEVRTPRAEADILVAFWSPAPNDSRLGSASPFSPVAVIRLDCGSIERDREVIVHQLLSLFGVPLSPDPKSVMNANPSLLEVDSVSRGYLAETRLFDFSKGLAGMDRRMQSSVLDVLERGSAKSGESPRLQLARLLMRDNRPAAAVEQFRLAVKSNPADLKARIGLARSLALTSQFKDAEAEARAAVKLAPNSDDSLYELGYVLARAGRQEDAVESFRQAIALAPNSARNHAGLAVAYFGTIGELAAASREFEIANKLDPSNPMVLADIDYVQHLRNRIEKDAEAAEAQVNAHPDSGPARDRLAVLLIRLGKTAEAMENGQEALKLGPDRWQTHYILAVAYYTNHDFTKAQMELEQSKKLGSGARPRLDESIRAAIARGTQPAN